jgi:hypothetical protein
MYSEISFEPVHFFNANRPFKKFDRADPKPVFAAKEKSMPCVPINYKITQRNCQC